VTVVNRENFFLFTIASLAKEPIGTHTP